MFDSLKSKFSEYRAKRIAWILSPYIPKGARVLDVGCGDLLIGKMLTKLSRAHISGVDVIDINQISLPFQLYNGTTLPYPDNSFDVVYASFVLHHIDADNQKKVLGECIRVAKRGVLFLEDIVRNKFDKKLLSFLDRSNLFLAKDMSLPFTFQTHDGWLTMSNSFEKVLSMSTRQISPNPFRPTKHELFYLKLRDTR